MINLLTLVDITLDHHTHDGIFSFRNLLSQDSSHLGLVLMVFQRVSVTAVDHQSLPNTSLFQRSFRLLNTLGIIVSSLGTTSQDNEAVFISYSANNSDDTRF